ncbi:NAD(P)H-dependent oxidoreductase [Cupriavidus sp. 30B13]|uniref:NAD(P)H-dependent oxidoreductase n=1 Tax=Cupriavidus sp. 30B13 TaxID=3384241 RepID=UPI003B90E269
MTQLISKLQWRYATKKYDPARVVPHDKLERIVEAIRLAPTSSGLQPFELIVIRNPELRRKILPLAYGQPQVAECSHLLVLAAWADVTAERIDMMFDLTNTERGSTNEGWEAYRQVLIARHTGQDAEANFQFAARQAYIGLGAGLIAAAFEEVDSTPMEGFDAAALDELLGLPARQLRSVSMLALGYREAAGDWLVGLKKVRRPREDFVTDLA